MLQIHTDRMKNANRQFDLQGTIMPTAKKAEWKAMLQIHTDRMKNANRQFDLQGTIMPTAKKAEWLICVCLNKTGSSGYLGPGAIARATG